MTNCNNKISHTCGQRTYLVCSEYEGTVNTDSSLTEESCLNGQEVVQDIYNQLENLDLSALGDLCLSYTTVGGKNIVKNVLLKFEEKICELSEKVNLLENRPLCEMPLGCVDVKCLSDVCNNEITTVGQLLQALVDKQCEVE